MACYIYHFHYFLQKSKITFEVAFFGESLLSDGSLTFGICNTGKISSLLSEGRYFFRNFKVTQWVSTDG